MVMNALWQWAAHPCMKDPRCCFPTKMRTYHLISELNAIAGHPTRIILKEIFLETSWMPLTQLIFLQSS